MSVKYKFIHKINYAEGEKMCDFRPIDLEQKSTQELQETLYEISQQVIQNGAVQHKAVINAMVINQILLLRFSENQERRNTKLQYINVFVAICALVVSLITIFK